MRNNSLFQKYYKKLAFEGWLKALIWGFNAGCVVFAITLFIGWATGFDAAVWLSVGVGVAVCALCTVILYFMMFRPTSEQIARRLDSLGLEERMITMNELRQDASYIAMRQREDAKEKLAAVKSDAVKVRPFAAADGTKASRREVALTIAATVISPILAVLMIVLFVLSLYSVLPGGDEIFNPEAEPTFVLVSYMDGDGGIVQGEADQVVEVGGSTQPVLAVADEGYAFTEWSDGYKKPSRTDTNVQEDIFVFPQFQEVGDSSDGESGDEPSDEPSDQPQEGESDSSDGDPNKDPQDGSNTPPPDSSGNIIDGATDYRDIYEQYYEEIMQILNSGELTEEMKEFLKTYFDSLL